MGIPPRFCNHVAHGKGHRTRPFPKGGGWGDSAALMSPEAAVAPRHQRPTQAMLRKPPSGPTPWLLKTSKGEGDETRLMRNGSKSIAWVHVPCPGGTSRSLW